MFRGVCVDNRDPKNLGRIRVQVPQILGTAASGWAFPAWSFHQKTIWPQDRLPKPGDGVWVMFDSTSPDKMIWIAAFGPLDLINQPEFVEQPDFNSTLTLEILDPPVWNEISRFAGILGSDEGGVPNPNPTVQLTGRASGGSWLVLGSAPVNPTTGEWSLGHRVQLTGSVEYRASFDGVGVYGPASSPITMVNTPTVTFPTTLTMSLNDPSPALNKSVEFKGVLSASTAPTGYTIPPDATVTFSVRPSGGSWQTVATGIPVDPTTGAWSTKYTINIAGAVDYQASFAGFGIYLPSQSSVVSVNTSVSTSVSTPSLPALYYGTGFNVSGTVKVASTGASVTSGVVELWWRYTIGGDQTWKKSSASANVASGTYSLTHPSLTLLGNTEWQVRYVGTTSFDPANSAVAAGVVNLRDQGSLTKGAVTHTSAAFSWAAVSGATSYEIERWNGSAWITLATTSALSYTDSTISNGQFWWRVRPKATNVGGTVMYGGYSGNITMTTGRPAQFDSGTTGWINVTVQLIDSHRIDQGWGYPSAPKFYQGYFSSSYGGEGYVGIAKYTGTRVRDAIIAACGGGTLGTTRQQQGTCVAAEIELKRGNASGSGESGGPVSIGFTTTTSDGTGSRPVRDGTTKSVDSTSANAGSFTYHDIGTAHGQRIGDAGANSISIYRNSSANYANFDVRDLRLKWSWSYTSVTYVAPSWL
jgi:hypothetical protein